jgi:filamentous hemagglutinin
MTVAIAPIEKFRDYIFKPGATHGKDHVFLSLGYDRSHSAALAILFERQAADRYAHQDFSIGRLDEHGQRVNIEIELPGVGEYTGLISYLISGWIIRSNNSITLTTPFSGFAR